MRILFDIIFVEIGVYLKEDSIVSEVLDQIYFIRANSLQECHKFPDILF